MTFSEVEGMTELNDGKPRRIKNCRVSVEYRPSSFFGPSRQMPLSLPPVISETKWHAGEEESQADASQTSTDGQIVYQAHSFEVEADTRRLEQYQRGGLVTQSKEPKTLHFQTLAQALKNPGDFLISDFAKMDRPPVLHVAFQALDAFQVTLPLHLQCQI